MQTTTRQIEGTDTRIETRITRWMRRPMAIALAVALTGLASAVELRWDIVQDNGAIDDGDEVWNTTTPNWTADGGGNNVAWNNAAGDDAEFGGTHAFSRTVTLGSDISVNRILSANSTSTTINQGDGENFVLKVGGGTTPGIGNHGGRLNNYTINVPIELQGNTTFGAFTGTYRLNQNISESTPSILILGSSFQSGGFYLLGNNTYSGGTNIGAGDWHLGSDTALGSGRVRVTASRIATFHGTGGSRTLDNDFTTTYANDNQVTGLGVAGDHDFRFNGTITSSGATGTTFDFDIAAGRTAEFAGQVTSNNRNYRKLGGGTAIFSADNPFTGGSFTVMEGILLINGDQSGNTGMTISADAAIGGGGTIGGNLVLDDGAKFWFDPTDTLTVNGATVDLGNLGVANILNLDASTTPGTYTLIGGTAMFDFTTVQNLGANNAFPLGGYTVAYFEEGSLNLVVAIPEPTSLALLALAGLTLLRRRRR